MTVVQPLQKTGARWRSLTEVQTGDQLFNRKRRLEAADGGDRMWSARQSAVAL